MEPKKIHFKGIENAQFDLLSYIQKRFKEALMRKGIIIKNKGHEML